MKKIFYSAYGLATLSLVLVQQLIVASSTLWLAKLFFAISNHTDYLTYLVLFLASLIFPYIPAYCSLLTLANWKQQSFGKLIRQFSENNYGHPQNWTDLNLKSKRLAFFCNEAFNVVGDFLFFIFDAMSLFLNVILNIIMIGFVVDPNFFYAYLLCLAITIFSAIASKKTISNATKLAQDSRVALNGILLKSWDNVVLSNRHNHELWNEHAFEKLKTSAKYDIRLTNVTSAIAEVTSALSVMPIFVALIYIVSVHQSDYAFLAIIFSSLPRQLIILNHLYALTTYTGKLHQVSSQIKGLMGILAQQEPQTTDYRIQWSKLQFQNGDKSFSCRSINEMQKMTNDFATGVRWTVRGENGSGKSTLLIKLKAQFSDEAFYLPIKNELIFSCKTDELSTGQGVTKVLEEILDKVNCKILLLDEWDANLDPDNVHKINQMLDRLKSKFCLIEIRHRI